MSPRLRDRLRLRGERGSGIVEFVLLVVIIFVPLTYGVLAFSAVQRTVLAATDAARQAGRAVASASDPIVALDRAEYAARLAADSQDVATDGMQVWTAPASSDCSRRSSSHMPSLASGSVFVVCVELPIRLPLLPDLLSANTATGRYVVAMDSFR